MKPLLSLSIVFFMSCFASCYKVEVERNTLPQGYSVAQIIGSWKITAVTSDKAYDWDGNGSAETDIFSTFSSCEKDNLYQFNQDYSAAFKTSCTDTKDGSWRLNGTITLVWIPAGGPEMYEKIIYMTTDTMKTETLVTQSNGQTYTITKTWKFQ